MILGISEDFSIEVALDSDLTNIPESGLYLNSGVHPSITTQNLLEFLPNLFFSFDNWESSKSYVPFNTSRNKKDIVTHDNKIWQCKVANSDSEPASNNANWVETNLESLRLKMWINKVKDRVLSDLALTKRLVTNQYIYDSGRDKNVKNIGGDYIGWVLEPKGSDYVKIRINQMSLEKDGTTPVNLYVINQGELVNSLTLTPANGKIQFNDLNLELAGKGKFILAIDSTDVYVGHATIDPLKYDGFVAYTTIGNGETPQGAKYTYNTLGNGIGLNLSVFMDAETYIENNLKDLANYIRATFELMTLEMFLFNSNNRSNRNQRIQLDDQLLIGETKNMNAETVVKRYHREKKQAINAMKKTLDTQLNNHFEYEITVGSV